MVQSLLEPPALAINLTASVVRPVRLEENAAARHVTVAPSARIQNDVNHRPGITTMSYV